MTFAERDGECFGFALTWRLTGARFLFSVTELINDSFHAPSPSSTLYFAFLPFSSLFLFLFSSYLSFCLKTCLFTHRDSVVVHRKVVKRPRAHARTESSVILMRFVSFRQHQSRLHSNFSPRATPYFRKSATSFPEVPPRRRRCRRLGRSPS